MHSLFAGIHIQNKTNEFLPLDNIDFGKTVFYLKEEIAGKLQYDANNIELIYNGNALDDDLQLEGVIRPNAIVHCFKKTKKYQPYQPPSDITSEKSIVRVQELFNVIAHIQISVNSRVNILQKILAEHPELRRNLAAQALIRDSVLFNTLHEPDVIKNVANIYPIICEAAPFIVDTIKKELARNASTTNFSEPTTDSTNSSEEENSLGPSSNVRSSSASESAASIRSISRQQLQAALAEIGFGSVNSLANIAQREAIASTTTTAAPITSSGSVPLSNSASGERISSELFRTELQHALNALNQRGPNDEANSMDTSETPTTAVAATAAAAVAAAAAADAPASSSSCLDMSDEGWSDGSIPAEYRDHEYVEQLRTMAQMGFVNYDLNVAYLTLASGSIENAINLLMGAMN